MACGRHPVGGQLDVRQLFNTGGGQVGDRFCYRHAAGSRRIQQGQRGTLAHGHGFTGIHIKAGSGDGAIGNRDLPGADHLVAGNQASDAAITNGNQEALAGNGGQTQYAVSSFGQLYGCGIKVVALLSLAGHAAVHTWRLAEQYRERHINRLVVEVLIVQHQQLLFCGFTNDGKGATLALTNGLKTLVVGVRYRHDVAFLGFVGPDLQWAHARLVVRYIAQFKATTASAIIDQLREGVGQTACTYVMDEGDGVFVTQLPAPVDNLLTAALHFRVFALYRGKIQVLGTAAGRHGRGCATAQTNQHGWAAQYHQLGTHRNLGLLNVVGADVTHATGDHDRLVVTTGFRATWRGNRLFKGTEVAVQVGTAKFIVERGAAQRTFDHDLQRGNNARWLAVVFFPVMGEAGNAQVGHGKAAQTGLGLAADTGRAFITNLAAGTGRRTREWRNRGRVVMRFDLHQDMHRLFMRAVLIAARHREEAASGKAFNHGSVIFIGRQHAFGVQLEGVFDHAEQAFLLRLAIDIPGGIKDLVAAVLGVGLGKHHQLDIAGVTLQGSKALDQIIDLVISQRQPQAVVSLGQGGTPACQHVHPLKRLGLRMREQASGSVQIVQCYLGHAVV